MISSLMKFLKYLNIDENENFEKKPNANQKESSQMIEINEKDNVFKEESKIITKFENGKEIKVAITTQNIPVGKTSAIKKVKTERII